MLKPYRSCDVYHLPTGNLTNGLIFSIVYQMVIQLDWYVSIVFFHSISTGISTGLSNVHQRISTGDSDFADSFAIEYTFPNTLGRATMDLSRL